MKALLICFFVVIAVAATEAQNQINISFGMNVSSADAKHTLFNSYSPMMRNYLGFKASRSLNDVSALSVGITYSQKGFRRMVNELAPAATFNELIKSKSKIDYAEMLIDYSRKLNQRVVISGGIYLGIISQIKQEGVLRTTTELLYLKNSDLPEMNKVDYGVSIGLEYQWFERWMLEAQFSQGLKQLYVNPDYYNNAKMRNYSFGIGYRLLKK
jgi:hypothetical protein